MAKALFYAPIAAVLAIASWFYIRGEDVPDAMYPIIVLLFAAGAFGYGKKAQEDGDIGAGSGKIRRDRSPRAFRFALYATYAMSGALVVWAVYLFIT